MELPTMTDRFADIRLLMFDLDGTLVDSAQGIIDSINAVLVEHDLAPAPHHEAASMIGLSLTDFWRRFAPQHQGHWHAFTDRYRTIYHDTAIPNSQLFPSVADTIKELHAVGYTLTIASSKITPVSSIVLRHVGLLEYFSLLMGDDRVENPKPHPEMVQRTLAECGFMSAQALMIGDSTYDIAMGQAAHVRTVAVTAGTHDAATLIATQPTIVINQLSELLDYVPMLR